MSGPVPPKVDRERPLTLESVNGVPVGDASSTKIPVKTKSWYGRAWSQAMGKSRQAGNAEATNRASMSSPFTRSKQVHPGPGFQGSKQVPPQKSVPQMQAENGQVGLIVIRQQELLSGVGSGPELISQLQSNPEVLEAFNVWIKQNPDAKENSDFTLKVIQSLQTVKGGAADVVPAGEPFSAFSETTQNLISKAKITMSRGNYQEINAVVQKLRQLDISVLKEIYRGHIDASSAQQINVAGGMYNLAKDAHDKSSSQELAEGIAICLFEVAAMVSGNLRQIALK
jgi:hypothetical protein